MPKRALRLPKPETNSRAPEKKLSFKYFSIRVYGGGKEEKNRLAISIGVRAERRAAKRHFWKRQFVERIARWPSLKKDLLIIGSPALANATRGALWEELDRALEEIKNTNR